MTSLTLRFDRVVKTGRGLEFEYVQTGVMGEESAGRVRLNEIQYENLERRIYIRAELSAVDGEVAHAE